ncbi:hypothetical protein BH18CHL2_BH18CHL2_02990 [soil metagenome]
MAKRSANLLGMTTRGPDPDRIPDRDVERSADRDVDRVVDRRVDRVADRDADRVADREIDRAERDDTRVVERVDRVERVEEPRAYAAPAAAPQTNVNTAPAAVTAAPSPVWGFTRVVTLLLTVLEVLLLARVLLRLFGANPEQPLVSGLYGITEPLVRPFQGIFNAPANSPLDVAALLAILFLFLVAALIVALVRAIAGRSA